MPSFDIVSRVDFQEIDNAIANALREITNRYDFKGSNTTLERSEKVITIVTDDDLKLSQVNDILISHFVRRKLDPLALGKKDKEKAGGDRIRQTISLVEGIEQDIAKKITSEIKSSKMKIQAKINGNELRIDGKKRDDLQSAMQLIEDLQVGIPVQFINFRD
ncbi:YajQ family cyclic di-GMP-binding protein [Pelagibacterales bacterium SAG-MED31]|nr:YajQ family cyclic di-GMP-binding protein [Pelagibacterales bacterium SAG-MED31]